jgi:Yersinia/Haemophilus virulence surface antigen
MTQPLMDQMTASAYTLLKETKNAAQAEFNAKLARLQVERNNKGMNQAFWTDFARRMDTALNTGAHSFQSLSTDKAYSKQDVYGPPNGLVALANRVVNHRKLQAGCGALVVVSPPKSDVGHAVAIHNLNTGRVHLFDPNFGVYEFDNFNVRKAFIFLFLKVYPELMDGARRAQDSQTYQVNGQAGGNFVIFRPPGVAPPQ